MSTNDDPCIAYARPEALQRFNGPLGLTQAEEHLIGEFFPAPPARVLDLGCGNGRTTVPLRARGYATMGLDVCEPLVEAARRHDPGGEYEVGDARHLEHPEGRFDAVLFSWNGMDHLRPVGQRLRCLREVHRVLKPGGCFLFSSHNALGLCARSVRSFFLLRGTLRFLMDQGRAAREGGAWYCVWRDPALGLPVFFSGPPRVNVRALHATGFEVLAARGDAAPGRPARVLADVHVHYACRKPGTQAHAGSRL